MEDFAWNDSAIERSAPKRKLNKSGPITYRKELRELTGSVKAALLMGQLEYWFSRPKIKKPFYKFLTPCNSPLYKPGDSWTEELGFTKDEFNSAFDRIGVRFVSKKEFDANLAKREQAGESFYYSIHNKIQHLTYYFRNRENVEAALRRISPKS